MRATRCEALRRFTWLVSVLSTVVPCCLVGEAMADRRSEGLYQAKRNRLVDRQIVGAGITNPRVVAAMRATRRHEFIPPSQRRNAYFDMALPIGGGQTISPPFV
ncbi:MAG: protein-L-isoaspartate O-methyltransferase, partial [Pirellulales bacterium]